MKLLIVTQVVDTNHPILGFFHRWLEEFSKHCEQVHVICLQEGKHSLPSNVTVHSLGKEGGEGRFVYFINFYKLIWKLRHEYDNVFVHMNQIYVILGAPFWRAFGKKIGLWYMHGSVSFSLRIAEKLTNKIFTGSPESFRLESKKVLVTGHGIDVNKFTQKLVTKDLDLITVGRITQSKNLFALVDIVKEVAITHNVTLTIVGQAVTEAESEYESKLKSYIQKLDLQERVKFTDRITHAELPQYLNRSKIFLTVAQNGSLDKVVLEAMACALPVISMAPGTMSLNLGEGQVETKEEFIKQLKTMLESKVYVSKENRGLVAESHSIQSLIPRIIKSLYGV